jgi:chromosomal replication initiation ATPase DnaA
MAKQIPLPLEPTAHFGREDFLVGPGNREALAFLDSWPAWPAPAAALYGPPGSGKTHLAHVWAARAGARIIEASALSDREIPLGALAVENTGASLTDAAERTLFALLERGEPLLVTGREPPARWPARLPDLVSRLNALLAFPLWAPDDDLLEALAKKLFSDRQLTVPPAVAAQMVQTLERSPAAIRDFVARADREAMARKCRIGLSLVRELLASED